MLKTVATLAAPLMGLVTMGLPGLGGGIAIDLAVIITINITIKM